MVFTSTLMETAKTQDLISIHPRYERIIVRTISFRTNFLSQKFVFIFKIQSFNLLQTLQKDHGFIFSTDSDYHSGDFGNIVVDGNSFSEQSFTVSSDIAGIFADNENNVSER